MQQDPEKQPLAQAYPPVSYEDVNAPRVIVLDTQSTPIGLILFIIGWCFPIAWFIGSCYPATITKEDKKWKKLNRIFTGICMAAFVLSIVLFAIAVANEPEVLSVPVNRPNDAFYFFVVK